MLTCLGLVWFVGRGGGRSRGRCTGRASETKSGIDSLGMQPSSACQSFRSSINAHIYASSHASVPQTWNRPSVHESIEPISSPSLPSIHQSMHPCAHAAIHAQYRHRSMYISSGRPFIRHLMHAQSTTPASNVVVHALRHKYIDPAMKPCIVHPPTHWTSTTCTGCKVCRVKRVIRLRPIHTVGQKQRCYIWFCLVTGCSSRVIRRCSA